MAFLQGYSYRLKIINSKKKSDFIIRDIHRFHGVFTSILDLKEKIMDEFGNDVPATTNFNVGYFSGRQSAKRWIMTREDLDLMYKNKKDILLWCDACKQPNEKDCSPTGSKPAATSNEPTSKHQKIELEMDSIVSELKEKHCSNYTMPQLRLWARMIISGHHESTVDPPDVPAITGIEKKTKKQSMSEAIVEAATSFASAIRSPQPNIPGEKTQTPPKSIADAHRPIGLSPGRTAELRFTKLQELKELQLLLDQNILTEDEFLEQKGLVLSSLCKLT